MDYDNDGILDIISGSYDPGDIYLFRGLGKGKYAKIEPLLDKSGLPLVHHPREMARYQELEKDPNADQDKSIEARVASFGSWPAMVDWDGDGDLDMLIGSFAGEIVLRVNEGTRAEPVFSDEAIHVEAAGQPLKVNGHAAPVVADWDADGRWDLVVGASDGAVGWFRNNGTEGKPELEAYRQLVAPAAADKILFQYLDGDQAISPGVRAQICVTDFNGDGRLDLIVGDYRDVARVRNDLTEKQRTELNELRRLSDKAINRAREIREAWSKDPMNDSYRNQLTALTPGFQLIETKTQPYLEGEPVRLSYIWLYLRNEERLAAAAKPIDTAGKEAIGSAVAKKGPVSISARLSPAGNRDKEIEVSVTVDIAEGWHLYRDVPEGGVGIATQLNFDLPEGIRAVGELQRPAGLPSKSDSRTTIYEGEVTFRQVLAVGDAPTAARDVEIVLEFQVCNERLCLPPSELKCRIALP